MGFTKNKLEFILARKAVEQLIPMGCMNAMRTLDSVRNGQEALIHEWIPDEKMEALMKYSYITDWLSAREIEGERGLTWCVFSDAWMENIELKSGILQCL